ncbi:MAG TPA: methylated-DNA--[protein]-cysteine S-methyltransferase [Bacteroidia bacterium]|nr:methylated-DNA--[protein]-cysteine S-methyltransferase [Bacteroidia bacterium]
MSTAFTEIASPLGKIVLTATEQGLSGLYFEGQRWFPSEAERADWRRDDAPFAAARSWLAAYFSGQFVPYTEPLDLRGGEFAQSVWAELRRIPPGETRTYAGIAQAIGNPKAVRAVGAAIGRNPVSVIVPCHRVVGSGGALTGYAGGIDRKRQLLELEGALR